MVEILRTNDLVLISAIEALLHAERIAFLVADQHMSAVEGSLGFLPRRILVADNLATRARRVLHEAGLLGKRRMGEGRSCESRDAFLDGRLILRQPARGHRAGTDAILLAASTPGSSGDLVDAGAGVGTAGLAVAVRAPGWRLRLVERDPEIARFAHANVAANGLADRAEVVVTDFLRAADRRRAGLADASADCVICNPPFHALGAVRASPDARRAAAHVEAGGDGDPTGPWLRAIAAVLRPGGAMILIHRAAALEALLAACRGRFGALAIRPIHPRGDAEASRVLLHGVKGSRAPLRLLPGLVLHGADGAFTPEAEAVHRGRALISWN